MNTAEPRPGKRSISASRCWMTSHFSVVTAAVSQKKIINCADLARSSPERPDHLHEVTSQKRGARAPLRLAKWIREAHSPRSGALRPPVCLNTTTALFFVDLDCIVVSWVLRDSAKSGFTNGSGKASAVVVLTHPPTYWDDTSWSNFSKKGGTREWHLDNEILEKNARNKIRVHQCLPIVEKILEKPK